MTPEAPFCLESLIRFLKRFPYPMGERVGEPGRVNRLFQDENGQLVAVALSGSAVTSDQPLSDYVSERVRHVFEFDGRVRKELAEHTHGAWLGRAHSLPVLRWDDTFAALVSSVIEQQTSWRQALKSIDSAFRKSRRQKGGLALFPSPLEFLENADILEGMPITYRRKDLIRELARMFREEPDFVDSLCSDLDKAESKLLAIKGIGPWTARVFLSKRYGYRRVVPTNDVALQRAAAHFLLGENRKMGEEELARHLSVFGQLSAEASHRLLIRWVMETYPEKSEIV